MNTTIRFVISIAIPLAVGGLSGFATRGGVATWYPSLVKPPFNPPAWAFGPVWTILYVMMGVAMFLVWRRGLSTGGVTVALAVFAVQMVLNGLWSVLFFGLQMPGWAFVEIVLLWLAIALTVWLFWRIVPAAGALLLPYLAWVGFAAVLNYSLWSLNR